MPSYEVCLAFTHCLEVDAANPEEAEKIALERMESGRGAAFDTREVSSVHALAEGGTIEVYKAARDMEAA